MTHTQFINVLREARVKSHTRTSKLGKKYTVGDFERGPAGSIDSFRMSTNRGRYRIVSGKTSNGTPIHTLRFKKSGTKRDIMLGRYAKIGLAKSKAVSHSRLKSFEKW